MNGNKIGEFEGAWHGGGWGELIAHGKLNLAEGLC